MTQREFLAALFIRDLLGLYLAELSGTQKEAQVLGVIRLNELQAANVRRCVVQAYAMADACISEAPAGATTIDKPPVKP